MATSTHATAPCLDIDQTDAGIQCDFQIGLLVVQRLLCKRPGRQSKKPRSSAPAANNNTAGGTSSLTNTFVNGANESSVPPVAFARLSDAELPPAQKSFLTSTNYIGAVRDGADTWWQGWTCGLGGGPAC